MGRRRKQSNSSSTPLLMEDMDMDENVPPKAMVEEELPKKKVIRRNAAKKQVPELDVEATEKKVEEKLEYLLSDYPSLLEKACKNEKGQKTLVKRLWSDHEEVVQQCSVNSLRHALWEPSFIASTEGVRFCAYALRKIGVQKAFLLMKKMVVGGATK
ncbi:unnamed protein product [Strongylus vulgaris]|uniref:Uncharacterized protein n=1 Tax=Strongylus vulgaris TaxID=40348 RepID=A0A3P7ILT0_STRVU|nr:unnamed protein product [Strongylus vulgaris]